MTVIASQADGTIVRMFDTSQLAGNWVTTLPVAAGGAGGAADVNAAGVLQLYEDVQGCDAPDDTGRGPATGETPSTSVGGCSCASRSGPEGAVGFAAAALAVSLGYTRRGARDTARGGNACRLESGRSRR